MHLSADLEEVGQLVDHQLAAHLHRQVPQQALSLNSGSLVNFDLNFYTIA